MRLSFFLGEAFESLKRNWVMTIASVMTVFITMTILGLVMVTDRNLNQGATSLKNRVLIEVFIKDEAAPEAVPPPPEATTCTWAMYRTPAEPPNALDLSRETSGLYCPSTM